MVEWNENYKKELKDIHGRDVDQDEFLEILYMNLPRKGYEALKVSFGRQKHRSVDPITLEILESQLLDYDMD